MQLLDSIIIGSYLLFSLIVSIVVFRKMKAGRAQFFLANRSIPWWWAGVSIAATTFAADTPLAITGLVASKGFAGNWLWLSWIFMHAAAAVFFASLWRRSEVITDAQIISLRYSGKAAPLLRLFKSGFYAVFFNCLILGWVIRAMVKILTPFFIDSPIAGYESFILVGMVVVYCSTGGLRAVVATDLFQLGIAIFGSYMLAYFALEHVGGIAGMVDGLKNLYGQDQHFTNFVPLPPDGTASWSFVTGTIFTIYLFAQAFSNSPADGGGYLMQRLAACESSAGAKKAAILFIFIQYFVRLWPWMIVALVALIVFPLGQESMVLAGKYAYLATDREAAYPALMEILLPTGFLGIAVLGMLAAFMSTVDTHLNWGSSYIVNDFLTFFKPKASVRLQMIVTRISILIFAITGILVSYRIHNIADAWKWLSLLGAGFSVPTLLRWFWWRINATSEFTALGLGLMVAIVVGNSDEASFHLQLVLVTAASVIGTLLGVRFGPPTEPEQIRKFVEKVRPLGYWGKFNDSRSANRQLYYKIGQYVALISIVICSLFFGQSLINARFDRTIKYTIAGIVLFALYEVFRRKIVKEVKI